MVVQTRSQSYPRREGIHRVPDLQNPSRKRKLVKRRDDPGGRGTEIVRELTVCPDYASGGLTLLESSE